MSPDTPVRENREELCVRRRGWLSLQLGTGIWIEYELGIGVALDLWRRERLCDAIAEMAWPKSGYFFDIRTTRGDSYASERPVEPHPLETLPKSGPESTIVLVRVLWSVGVLADDSLGHNYLPRSYVLPLLSIGPRVVLRLAADMDEWKSSRPRFERAST